MNEPEIINSSTNHHCLCSGAWWRLPVLLALVLAAILIARSLQRGEWSSRQLPVVPPAVDSTGQTVSLTIQTSEQDVRHWANIPWQAGMTVGELLNSASRLDGLTYSLQGNGEMTLLTRLGENPNEGVNGRNWTYFVNGERADRSLASFELRPGDRVLWTFAAEE